MGLDERIGVLFVCLGNICRSPMAEGLFAHMVQQRGLGPRFRIESAGTAAYHVGESPDPRTLAVLRKNGISLGSRARQVRRSDFDEFDWILAMDSSNLSNLRRVCPDHLHPKLHRTLDPIGGGDVADPYYGGPSGFDDNFAQLEQALDVWLERMLVS